MRASVFCLVVLAAIGSFAVADELRDASQSSNPGGCVPVRQQLQSHLKRLDEYVTGKADKSQQAPKKGSQKLQKQKPKQQSLAPAKGKGSFLQIASRLHLGASARAQEQLHALNQLRSKLVLETYKPPPATIKDNFATLATLVSDNKKKWDDIDLSGFTINCEAAAFMDEASSGKADLAAANDQNVHLKARLMYYSVLAELMWEAEEKYADAQPRAAKCYVAPKVSPKSPDGDHIINFALIGTPLFDTFLGDRNLQDKTINSLSAKAFANDPPALMQHKKDGQSLTMTKTDNNAFLFDHLRLVLLQAMYPYVKGKPAMDALYAYNVGLVTDTSYDELKTVYKKKARDDWPAIDKFNSEQTVELKKLLTASNGPDFTEDKKKRIALSKPTFDTLEALKKDDALLKIAFELMTLSAVDLTALIRACHVPDMIQLFQYTAPPKIEALVKAAPFNIKFSAVLKAGPVEEGVTKLCKLDPKDHTEAKFVELVTKKEYETKIGDPAVAELCKKVAARDLEETAAKEKVWTDYNAMIHKLVDEKSFTTFLSKLKE